jgi:glycosyltransferase involved in cell wall biosynthesis
MKILFLTFYFEPDLCAGSFRNTPLFRSILEKLSKDDFIHVITTFPNRYAGFAPNTQATEKGENYLIERVQLPSHKSGFIDQAKSFIPYYKKVVQSIKGKQYDLVYASSSRLFTAFLGRVTSSRLNAPLYLDIRDIFVDTINDVIKNKYLKSILIPILKQVERYTFSKANHINLVSEGFTPYFQKYPIPSYSFFTNGIDDDFLSVEQSQVATRSSIKTILYAGNIGEGQGLEKIIPEAALQLGNSYRFLIIGGGGRKPLLEETIRNTGVQNITILPPMNRQELIEHYRFADFLFLHLNNYEAFKKVLPSKIFEYAVFNKPVIAGVGGYAAEFISKNVTDSILFEPTNVEQLVKAIQEYKLRPISRQDFTKKYSRKNIINEMNSDILRLANK